MSRVKEHPEMGLKLAVTVIPSKYLDWTLADIARHFGNGALLWPGGAGRAQGIKFVPYELKKTGAQTQAESAAARQPEPGSGSKTST